MSLLKSFFITGKEKTERGEISKQGNNFNDLLVQSVNKIRNAYFNFINNI